MVTKRPGQQRKPTVKKPSDLDLKRMEDDAKKIIKRDAAWLKEMADR
jgi:hypothetical protein